MCVYTCTGITYWEELWQEHAMVDYGTIVATPTTNAPHPVRTIYYGQSIYTISILLNLKVGCQLVMLGLFTLARRPCVWYVVGRFSSAVTAQFSGWCHLSRHRRCSSYRNSTALYMRPKSVSSRWYPHRTASLLVDSNHLCKHTLPAIQRL